MNANLEANLELIEANLQQARENMAEVAEIDRRISEAISQQRAKWVRAEEVAKEIHDARTLLKVRG